VDALAAGVLASFYVKNRRDGSRLLSSALVIFTIAITQHQTTLGRRGGIHQRLGLPVLGFRLPQTGS
jgi:hypothetical protein